VKDKALHFWKRAYQTFKAAKENLEIDTDTAASRAFYASFYAVSAILTIQGKSYSKHSAVQAAVHRDIIKTGLLNAEVGQDYDFLFRARNTADYGAEVYISSEEAEETVAAAKRILSQVYKTNPDLFSDPDKLF
jgi:uncharacterized protein (UPF0332 family)